MSLARDRFVRLAEARTRKLLKSLDVLGNLANRTNYNYSEEDVRKVFGALRKKLREVELRFEAAGTKRKDEDFKL
jgi:hypothetical protein